MPVLVRSLLLATLVAAGCSKSKPSDGSGTASPVVASDLTVIEPAAALAPTFSPTKLHTAIAKDKSPGVTALAFSADGKRLLVGSSAAENGVQVWDVAAAPAKVGEWAGTHGLMTPDGRHLVYDRLLESKPVVLVEVDANRAVRTLDRTGVVGGTVEHPDLLIMVRPHQGGGPGKAYVSGTSLTTGKNTFDGPMREGSTYMHISPYFNRGREVLILAEEEDTAEVWDVTTQKRSRQVTLALPADARRSWSGPVVHPTGRLVAAGVGVHGTLFWNSETGERVGQVANGLYSRTGAFHPTRDLFFSASNATRADPKGSPVEVVAYDVAAKTYVAAFRGGHAAGIDVIAVAPDGTRMATGDSAGQVRLWDLAGLN